MNKFWLFIIYFLGIAILCFVGAEGGFWPALFLLLLFVGGYFIFYKSKISSVNKKTQDAFYAQVAVEVQSKDFKPDIVARAAAESNGNKDLAQSLYIKYRVDQLMGEFKERQSKLNRKLWVENIGGVVFTVIIILCVRYLGTVVSQYFQSKKDIQNVQIQDTQKNNLSTGSSAVVHYPSPTGYVVDEAGIIDTTTRNRIEGWIEELKQKTTAEVAVVTVDSTEPLSIEDYAVNLFQRFGIGKKGKDNGVLILIALNDHHMRIEVGYGLEGAITDTYSSDIINTIMAPEFKAGNYSDGIEKATAAIVSTIAKENNVSLDSLFPSASSNDSAWYAVVTSNVLDVKGVVDTLIVQDPDEQSCQGDLKAHIDSQTVSTKCLRDDGTLHKYFEQASTSEWYLIWHLDNRYPRVEVMRFDNPSDRLYNVNQGVNEEYLLKSLIPGIQKAVKEAKAVVQINLVSPEGGLTKY